MANTENYQDLFLNEARKERLLVTVFLMNGFQMKGVVTGFDNFIVFLVTDGKQQMIYKHAISTVVPSRPVRLNVQG
ncbi:MAG: RNA chaperone Hfq [Faecousia sp.]|nr:RNA chaperone Hfq [Bacillota bacterium]MDY2720154.1 RNA chaperone Hfq [Candidatus Faecousia sp.]